MKPLFYRKFKVDVAVFRDLDSVVSEREIAAVGQWLNSKHAFHIMRDHPNHGAVPMMAGMWGVKVSYEYLYSGHHYSVYYSTQEYI